ncbi:MAG: hypothetical protein IJ718_06065 [Paludibacteraceae bacterium]|nr:hypothetical protein [Paludibacteraceae bacterium]
MRRTLFIISMLCVSIGLMAQYYAYSMNGVVRIMRGGEWQTVYSTMELQETDLLQTEEFGNITILDRTNNKIFSIQSTEARPVRQLMQAQPSTRMLATEYILGMLRKLFNQEQFEEAKTESYVTYRSEEDEREIARALIHSNQSKYLVSFTLIDLHSQQAVETVEEGQIVVVQFNNMSDTPLYMNIIDTDASGQVAAIFPIDEKQSTLTLYVPAFSNIRLHQYPIQFAPGGTTDHLMLVAYPIPFYLPDVIELMNKPEIINDSAFVNEPIGIYQMSVPIIPAGSY